MFFSLLLIYFFFCFFFVFICFFFFFFFFQAEDCIRNVAVTGVQTCALPIWRWRGTWRAPLPRPVAGCGCRTRRRCARLPPSRLSFDRRARPRSVRGSARRQAVPTKSVVQGCAPGRSRVFRTSQDPPCPPRAERRLRSASSSARRGR